MVTRRPIRVGSIGTLGTRLAIPDLEQLLAETSAPTSSVYQITNLNISQLTLDAAMDIGYGALFNGDASASALFFFLEQVALLPEVPLTSDGLVSVEQGVGIRVGIALTAAKANVQSSFVTLAAQGSTASVQVDLPGLPPSVAEKFLASFPSRSEQPLGLTDLQALFGSIGSTVQTMIDLSANQPSQLIATPLYLVDNPSSYDETRRYALSIGYALHCIAGRKISLSDALSHLATNQASTKYPYGQVDPFIVSAVYGDWVGGSSTTKPTSAQQKAAQTTEWTGH